MKLKMMQKISMIAHEKCSGFMAASTASAQLKSTSVYHCPYRHKVLNMKALSLDGSKIDIYNHERFITMDI